jgi:xyloglucan-specific exo-beta-1,4-glucanase
MNMKERYLSIAGQGKSHMRYLSILLFFISCIHAGYAQTATYNWKNVSIGGGGFVSGIVTSKSQANLMYARTDVGGAYRWDAANSQWIPLLDWVSESETGYLGVESIALDPNAPNKVYMLAGISYFNDGKSAILRSDDYGNTFTITDVTAQFKVHGNGMGRQNGERLQVDPNNGSILYTGTRWNGLFKSTNAGATWTRLTSLNVTTTPNENGICVVALDPTSVSNGVTQRIFAGVSRTGSNFYRSDNAGQTFTAVAGGPTQLMPQRAIIAGGFVYITYANGAGPHGHWAVPEPFDAGEIWKYNISTGAWTNITPSGFAGPFGGISADPANPQRLIASTTNMWRLQENAYGDRFFTSTNGGTGWTDLIAGGFDLDPNGVTWIEGQAIHWSGSIEFDPFNTQRVFVTSGNGVFTNDNISTAIWKFTVKGLEETVPMALESISNGPVLTVILDYDGFRHTDPQQYAPIHTPRIGSTPGLAYAALNPAKVLRVGTSMYTSSDMGQTWSQCTINGQKGQVAISADGNVFLHSPEASTTTYRSSNNGSSWTTVSGVNVSDARPVADKVNPNKFYIYNPSTGGMLVSTNGGTSFSQSGSTAAEGSKVIRTVPGREGDIWVPLNNGGLSRSVNSGQSFSLISGVSSCGAVGFGKAATGASFPAVYIWGTVNNVPGVYRSDNEGASWVRVNDDAHEYGGPANGQFVQGDMNVYGRVYMSTAGRGVVYGEASTPTSSLNVSPASLAYSSAGGTQAVSVTADVSWSVSSNAAWLTASPLSGSGNGSFNVTASANTGATRTGAITVTGGGLTRTISVSQAGATSNNDVVIRAKGSAGGEIIELRINNILISSYTLTKTFSNYTGSGSGNVTVHYINDAKRRDVQVDYVIIGGQTYQAEDQVTNTGAWVNGACGGSYSEWLNCNGYISFTTGSSGRSAMGAIHEAEIADSKSADGIYAYPNPAEEKLTVKLATLNDQTRITLIGITGKVHADEKPNALVHVIDMSNMPSGLYLIKVTDDKQRVIKKIYKK